MTTRLGVTGPARHTEDLDRLPTSAISEADLHRGYSMADADAMAVERRRPCACGDMIVVHHAGDKAIAYTVGLHNESPRHRHWRLGQGIA